MKVITNKKLFYRVQFFSNERNVLQLTFPANFICTLMSAIHRWKQIILSLSKKSKIISKEDSFYLYFPWNNNLTNLFPNTFNQMPRLCYRHQMEISLFSSFMLREREQTMQQQSADLTLFCSFAHFKSNFFLVNQAHKISQVEKIPVRMHHVWFQFFV